MRWSGHLADASKIRTTKSEAARLQDHAGEGSAAISCGRYDAGVVDKNSNGTINQSAQSMLCLLARLVGHECSAPLSHSVLHHGGVCPFSGRWNLTPEMAVTLYLGGNDWRSEHPLRSVQNDGIPYFVVDAWRNCPKVRRRAAIRISDVWY